MACLGAISYDPAVMVSVPITAAIGMTAFDTTNLRIIFTAPDNGRVFVRMWAVMTNLTAQPQVMLGVMEGSTIMGRMAIAPETTNVTGFTYMPAEVGFVVAGLTPGASLTWDAARSVELAVAAANFKWGGPDDTTAGSAAGGFHFEIWDA